MKRLTITLMQDERTALWELAQRERRDMRDQAALIIRRELEREGLLQPVTTAQAAGVQDGNH
jgi:hypothetical protein